MTQTTNPQAQPSGNLLAMVRQDVEAYLRSPRGIIINERDLQVSLAAYLRNSANKYDAVEVEYLVPIEELVKFSSQTWQEKLKKKYPQPDSPKLQPEADYPWNNKSSMWVDIVVCHEGEFVPIELKYATKPVNMASPLTRFGEPLLNNTNVQIVKDQAANDVIMYNFWKDVRRIELLKHRYSQISGGIALLVTNSKTYWGGGNARHNSSYMSFFTGQGRIVNNEYLKWSDKISPNILTGHPDLRIDGTYTCNWQDANITGLQLRPNGLFRYCLLEI